MWGQNPTIPGLSEGTAGSLKNVTESEVARKILQAQTQNMIRANQDKYDLKIKTAMQDRMPKESNIPFNNGDSVIYFDNKIKRKRGGNIIAQEGPSTWVSSKGRHTLSSNKITARKIWIS